MSDQFNIEEDAQSGGESSINGSQPPEATESAFPDEDEETITMQDVIERENELEEEAAAVLGNSDAKNCTYPKGYIPRQALYSCETCVDTDNKPAAICLACSLECHNNHVLHELYTKRNFRCDCGNSKFKSNFECKLMEKGSKKVPLNEQNKYNHNFDGKYCVCDKVFPPDDNDNSPEANDTMLQCIVCEDWYHSKHLGTKEIPSKFEEMICLQCVKKLDFIHYYRDIEKSEEQKSDSDSVTKISLNNNNNSATVDNNNDAASMIKDEHVPEKSKEPIAGSSKSVGSSSVVTNTNTCESDTNDSQAENKDPVSSEKIAQAEPQQANLSGRCILEELKSQTTEDVIEGVKEENCGDAANKPAIVNKEVSVESTLFWSSCNWRSKLCRCQKCLSMYKEKECEFLLDHKDTIPYYEAQGIANSKNGETPLERGMSALNKMNRAAVVEALHGYDELKADLSSYLKKFADSKKVVREEDIHEFFSQLKSKKRPRLEYED